jgi:hypothetical protein
MKTFKVLAAVIAIALACAATSAQASIIKVQFTGFNFEFDGTDIFDGTGSIGGNGLIGEADQLATLDILVDGVKQSIPADAYYADMLIKDIPTLNTGTEVTSGGNGPGFGLDILNSSGTKILSVTFDQLQVFYSGYGAFVAGGGTVYDVSEQNLPGIDGFDTGQPVEIAFVGTGLSNVSQSGSVISAFEALGTGEVSGQQVPEPASLAMLGLASLVGLVVWRRRGR